MKNRLMQASKLVPWRRQLQRLGLALLLIVVGSLTAWVYLSVSSQTSITGREIQGYQSEITDLEQSIAAMETSLAETSSSTQMAKRAKALGFKEIDPSRYEYMVIPEYAGKPSAQLAPDSPPAQAQSNVITSDFTESLWDWMFSSYIEPAITR